MRRKIKHRKRFSVRKVRVERVAMLLVLVICAPFLLRGLLQNTNLLTQTGERVAVLSAAILMPEGGVGLIRDRFSSDLHGEAVEAWGRPIPVTPSQSSDHETGDAGRLNSDAEETSSYGESGSSVAPKIPEAYLAQIISEDFSMSGSTALIRFGAGLIRNDTNLSDDEVEAFLEVPFAPEFSDTDEPQVLIVHTHATEAFERYDSEYYDMRNTWRSRDNNMNMVAVGAAMEAVLEENGIGVIHDTTQHDYPSYNGSYERSAETIQAYLDEYPSIQIVLDLHRDAMERDNNAIVKPVIEIDGKKAAQIMIIAACDNNGTLGVPNYPDNLRFAATLQNYMESDYTGLTRPILFSYRKYNMDLSSGSLLIEIGSNGNTLEEAMYSASLAGQALANLIKDHTFEW